MSDPGRGALAAAALLALAGTSVRCAPRPERPRHLVIVSLDTLRRDHLPTYGYERATAPALDALACASIVFERAFAQDTNTVPSHASMLTGLYPHQHGAVSNAHRLPADRPVLAEILRDAGFRTAGFVSGLTLVDRLSGLGRGFEVWDDEFPGFRRPGQIATERAIDWLGGRGRSERTFLFLHLYDAHGPYRPGGYYRALFRSSDPGPTLADIPRYQLFRDAAGAEQRGLQGYVDRYDAMIRYLDDRVADLLRHVDLERTLVIVLADHGETLGEREPSLDHGGRVFDEQTRIPLILHAPGLAARRIEPAVETVDLLPTVLELLGLEPRRDPRLPGRSLVPLLGGEGGGREQVFTSARADPQRTPERAAELDPARRIHSVRTERWKLIRYPGRLRDRVELYDLLADPGEREDVADRHEPERRHLLEILEDWRGEELPFPPIEADPELLRQLRQLGYVG